jgi:TatA/E family protein of Tat protein translocase
MHALLFLESIGTTELLVILVVALVVFGPRKLPEMGRMLGKSLGEFKRASDDFKRTWEREVETERVEQHGRIERAMIGAPEAPAAAVEAAEHRPAPADTLPPLEGEHVARERSAVAVPAAAAPEATAAPTSKSEWL